MKRFSSPLHIFCVLYLLVGMLPLSPVRTASAEPESVPPTGLNSDDWTQIEDLLAAALPSQQAYLKASNTEADDWFGYSVAVSGDTAVVGAPYESSNATGVNGDQSDNSAWYSGAAYVFVRSGSTWSQQAYLKASNTEWFDYFGESVAISGDTLVVGAWGEDSNAIGVNGDQGNNSAVNSGAAYVFTRSGGTWSQQAYLKASNTEADDIFGYSVAISGETVVVGAYWEDSNAIGVNGIQGDNSASNSGAAYVFTRDGTTWRQQAYLKASNTDADDVFGTSVAISGDTAVVGAYGEASSATGVNGNQSNNSAAISGAAYVFTRNDGIWSQQAYLKASNTEMWDNFGWSVAISDDMVVVGADEEDSNATGVDGNQSDNSASKAGAAYVFTRSGGTWSQQAYLKASNTGANDYFGYSVAISGDTVAVGAYNEDGNATGVNGNQNDNSASDSGAAYAFICSGTTCSQQSYLKASNTGIGDSFGWSVAVSGDTVVVGADGEDSNATGVDGNGGDNSASDSGAAYVFASPATILHVTLRSNGTQDGWILESGENTNKGGTLDSTATTLRLGDDSARKQYRSILSFSTGDLPDTAEITKVTLRVRRQGISGGGNPVATFQGFMVDIKRGLFGTAALQAADFQTKASRTYGTFNTALAGGWYSINLTTGKAYINKLSSGGGLTQIRLRFQKDDNGNAVANYLSLYSGNAPAASRPQLIVEYYVP